MARRPRKRSCQLCGERVTVLSKQNIITTATGAPHLNECSHFDPASRTELVTPESVAARKREIVEAKISAVTSLTPLSSTPTPSTHGECPECGFVMSRCRCGD